MPFAILFQEQPLTIPNSVTEVDHIASLVSLASNRQMPTAGSVANIDERHQAADRMPLRTRGKPLGVSGSTTAASFTTNFRQGNLKIGCQWTSNDETAKEKECK